MATRIESEDDEEVENVRIEAAVTSIDAVARTLVVLGVTVSADGETQIEDDSSIGDERLEFGEIGAGDYLRIEAGQPRFGAELSQDYIPLETNLWADISFNKGCQWNIKTPRTGLGVTLQF